MAEHLQSVKNLLKDFLINLLSGVAGGVLITILSGRFWVGILLFVLILIASFLYLRFSKYKRLFKLINGGATGYYYSFDLGENPKVFSEVEKSFYYLGISTNSILEYFRQWISANNAQKTYLFLLMDPDSPAIKRQVAFEKGVSLDTELSSINAQLSQMIEDAVEAEKKRILSAIEVLKNLPPFKEGKLRIRLHSEFIPWWMYIIDDKKIYLGILEKGKRGQDSPVMMISKHHDFSSLFDPFKNTWDKLWAEATEV